MMTMAQANRRAQEVACPRCGAEVGKPCVSMRGRQPPTYSHTSRFERRNAANEIARPEEFQLAVKRTEAVLPPGWGHVDEITQARMTAERAGFMRGLGMAALICRDPVHECDGGGYGGAERR